MRPSRARGAVAFRTRQRYRGNASSDRRLHVNLRTNCKCHFPNCQSYRGFGHRIAIGRGKHVTSRGPGRNRAEKTGHFEGAGSPSDPENATLGGARVAIGPRKHVIPRGPGRNRTEKTRHFEGPGSQSDRENTSLRGVRVAIGPRKHVTRRGPGRNRTEKTQTWRGPDHNQIEKTRHFEGTGSQSGRESRGIATPSGI